MHRLLSPRIGNYGNRRSYMDTEHLFDAEIARLRAANVAVSGTLTGELFNFLVDRWPDASGASSDDIAREVFEHEIDDATVCIYVRRLRKELADFYATQPPEEGGARIALPQETCALRLEDVEEGRARPGSYRANRPSTLIAAGVALAVLALVALLA